MADLELELKAVVPDPAALRRALVAAGAALTWAGLLEDRRFDRNGELAARGEALRTRTYRDHTADRTELTWKGPTTRTAEGYKARRELELELTHGAAPAAFLEALGFRVVHAIDRRIEQFDLDGAMVRVEWYPRMDVLVEVEGAPEAIERAVRGTGIPRSAFSADALADFVARYRQAHGRPAAVALAELAPGERPGWEPA